MFRRSLPTLSPIEHSAKGFPLPQWAVHNKEGDIIAMDYSLDRVGHKVVELGYDPDKVYYFYWEVAKDDS